MTEPTPKYVLIKKYLIGELYKFNPRPDKGFNYPFYLFIPKDYIKKNGYLIVEPNNTGKPDDNINVHDEEARLMSLSKFYIGNYLARNLNYPLLVPIFPRPMNNALIYTHALDRDTIMIRDGDMKRLDLQLIAMIHEAKEYFCRMNTPLREKIIMTGFSASGTFVNRFVMIHPEIIQVCAYGGLNGLLMLPIKKIKNTVLNYPLGVNDFERVFENKFNDELYKKIPQFVFMGALDTNDAVQFLDAFDKKEQQKVNSVIGAVMISDRWETCSRIYYENNVAAEIVTYSNLKHECPEMVKKDILFFIQKKCK